MKILLKLAFFLAIGTSISLSSCSDDEPDQPQITEEFSFELNGASVSFNDPNGGQNALEQFGVQGQEGTHLLQILVLNTDEGTFTEADIDADAGSNTRNYRLLYIDENNNQYQYSPNFASPGNFTITVSSFGGDEGSLISGTFSGTLPGSGFNDSTAPENVVITNGVFNVSRSDASSNNIW